MRRTKIKVVRIKSTHQDEKIPARLDIRLYVYFLRRNYLLISDMISAVTSSVKYGGTT